MMKMMLVFALALCVGLPAAYADVTYASVDYLGFIDPGVPAGHELDEVGTLISLSPGTLLSKLTIGNNTNYVTRNTNVPISPLPTANLATCTTRCTYELVKYDGANGFSEVWYVGDLSSTQSAPAHDHTGHNNPSAPLYFSATPASVPDGGVTLVLLGGVLVGIETLRRRFAS